MRRVVLMIAVLAVSAIGLNAAADPLPPGPGRNLVISKCSSCHAIAVIQNERHDEDGWQDVIDKMADRGLMISDPDRAGVVAYLVKAQGPAAAPATVKALPSKLAAKSAPRPVAKPKPKA